MKCHHIWSVYLDFGNFHEIMHSVPFKVYLSNFGNQVAQLGHQALKALHELHRPPAKWLPRTTSVGLRYGGFLRPVPNTVCAPTCPELFANVRGVAVTASAVKCEIWSGNYLGSQIPSLGSGEHSATWSGRGEGLTSVGNWNTDWGGREILEHHLTDRSQISLSLRRTDSLKPNSSFKAEWLALTKRTLKK